MLPLLLLGAGIVAVAALGYAGAFKETDVKPVQNKEFAGVREMLTERYPDGHVAFSGKNWAVSFMLNGKPVKPTLYFDAYGSSIRNDD